MSAMCKPMVGSSSRYKVEPGLRILRMRSFTARRYDVFRAGSGRRGQRGVRLGDSGTIAYELLEAGEHWQIVEAIKKAPVYSTEAFKVLIA